MFTGIVESTGSVEAIDAFEGGRRIRLRAPDVGDGLAVGDSVAVDGACLTAVEVGEEGFSVEAVGTTLSRTVAGDYGVGSVVNLERPVRVGDRLDGHIVQGHVDGIGVVRRVRDRGDHHLLDVEIPEEVHRGTVLHGSIALNGVSLTVNALSRPGLCQVAVIPHTWRVTNFSGLEPGDRMNVEGDLIGKYVGRILAERSTPRKPGTGGSS